MKKTQNDIGRQYSSHNLLTHPCGFQAVRYRGLGHADVSVSTSVASIDDLVGVGSHGAVLPPSVTNPREASSERFEDWVDDFAEKRSPNSSNPEKDQAKDLEEWREDEVVECSSEGEQQTPDESQRPSKDGCQKAIDPDLSVIEEHVGSSPDRLKTLGASRLRQNILEHNVDLAINALFIPIPDIQAQRQRIALLRHFGRLDLFTLLAFSGGDCFRHLNRLTLTAVRRRHRDIRVTKLDMFDRFWIVIFEALDRLGGDV